MRTDSGSWLVKMGDVQGVRQSTSALVGDPDPYPRVYKLRKFKLRSAQVIDNGGLGSAGQVPAKKQVPASTCTRSRSYGYLCLQTPLLTRMASIFLEVGMCVTQGDSFMHAVPVVLSAP